MKHPTNEEIANSFQLWGEYVDPSGIDTLETFSALSIEERLAVIATL